jgi:hypothetical protein
VSYPSPPVDPQYAAWLASQQQPAAPQYAPPAAPAQQYAQPPSAYAPAPQLMPQPQQYAPPAPAAPVQSVPAPGTNPFQAPRVAAATLTPRIKDLAGRLVAFRPTLFEPEAPNSLAGPNQAKTQPRVTADCYVFDGGTLVFGGSPDYDKKPTPHTHQVEPPTMLPGMWITSENIVRALTETPPGGRQQITPGLVLGRIVRSQVGNMPWNLEPVDMAGPEVAHCAAIFAQWQSGQSKPNQPVPLAQAAPPAPNPLQAMQVQAANAYQAQYGIPAPSPAELAYAAQQQQYAQPPAGFAPQPAPAPRSQYAPPAPMPQPAAPAGVPPFPPAGAWAAVPEQYAALSDADKAAVWAAAGPQSAAPAGNPFAQ